MWLWVYYNKIPIYPIFYLLKGDYRGLGVRGLRTKSFNSFHQEPDEEGEEAQSLSFGFTQGLGV